MFTSRRSRNILEATFTTLALIYHLAVYNLRKDHRNAVIGLLVTILQSSIFIIGFMAMYLIFGVKKSPLRGDFILYIMSGVFVFMINSRTAGAVSSAGSSLDTMVKHAPMNTAVTISGAMLSSLYQQTVSILVILWAYHTLVTPITIERPVAAYGMVLLSWLCGGAVGLIFLSIRSWSAQTGKIVTTLYQRMNMIFSGKMFVANAMPAMLLPMFTWNPLFHIIDQTRGFVFINYTPHNTNLSYPIYVTLAVFMIGLMAEFVTRRSVSVSWSAGR
ncbi:ABC transporter permease [Paracoccus aminophilus]|nr:ABC transporter [Paracoccus aminophilus]